ncbi:iron ABC transporter [bacterium]|nr:iron ABC transporter [bacterium]
MTWTIFDTWIAITGSLVAMSCALLGNFLMLRRMSMMGDAISHTVLPGLVAAFLLTGSRDVLPMFIGAILIGLLTAFLVQAISRYGSLDEGSVMGVVFTTLFALGLLLIVQAADKVDLDPSCVLYGAIELTPIDVRTILGHDIPIAALTNGIMLLVNAIIVVLFYKEFKLTAFDATFARSLGVNSGLMHYLLMSLVAATCVAAFESVGSILVIAMLIVPPACAFLLTRRLSAMIAVSLIVGIASAWGGHAAAVWVPLQLGLDSTSTAGGMATVAGLIFLTVFLLSPRNGLLAQVAGRLLLSLRFARIDLLGQFYRALERGGMELGLERSQLRSMAEAGFWRDPALFVMRLRGEVQTAAGRWRLTPHGELCARRHIRTHRLWESYLAEKAGMAPEKVHPSASRLGYFTQGAIEAELERKAGHSQRDPHDREIPE